MINFTLMSNYQEFIIHNEKRVFHIIVPIVWYEVYRVSNYRLHNSITFNSVNSFWKSWHVAVLIIWDALLA